MRRFLSGLAVLQVAVGLLAVSGCETEAQNKALIGGAIGAGAGQAIGRDTEGTLIGAGIGAGAGYLWGSMEDKKKESAVTTPTRTAASSGNVVTMYVPNSNGTRTEIKLTRNADGTYTGPRGEVYSKLPTLEQLKQDYGS